jgi:hypothetical protein
MSGEHAIVSAAGGIVVCVLRADEIVAGRRGDRDRRGHRQHAHRARAARDVGVLVVTA